MPANAENWFYLGLVALLAVILVHGGWVFYRMLRASRAPAREPGAPASTVIRDQRWYEQRAEDLARAGRYAQAMQALFLAQVLTLDHRRILRFHPSKTPGEYAREARLPPPERQEFLGLVRVLYRYAFAGETCRPEDFQAWRLGLLREWHAAEG